MQEITLGGPEGQPVSGAKSVLDEILREGARSMLGTAIEAEVAEYLSRHAGEVGREWASIGEGQRAFTATGAGDRGGSSIDSAAPGSSTGGRVRSSPARSCRRI